jgi:precorrin-6A/cobalt-precorrin-6A reductase
MDRCEDKGGNMTRRVLILGGTGEARELAACVVSDLSDKLEVITSLTRQPPPERTPTGELRIGRFANIEEFAKTLSSEAIDLVVDATHPFAETISMQAYAACIRSEKLMLSLQRPPWNMPREAKWTEVPDMKKAAEILPRFAHRVFVTTGHRDLEALNDVPRDEPEMWYLVRLHTEPAEVLALPNHHLITSTGPFSKDGEAALIAEHAIDTLIARESGGQAGQAKIDAAVDAGLHVVLISRPDPEPGNSVETVAEALAWLDQQS